MQSNYIVQVGLELTILLLPSPGIAGTYWHTQPHPPLGQSLIMYNKLALNSHVV